MNRALQEEHITSIREHLGDDIGWYLAFLRHVTIWLGPIAAIGACVTLFLNGKSMELKFHKK